MRDYRALVVFQDGSTAELKVKGAADRPHALAIAGAMLMNRGWKGRRDVACVSMSATAKAYPRLGKGRPKRRASRKRSHQPHAM